MEKYSFLDFGGNKINYGVVENLAYEKDASHVNTAFNSIAAMSACAPKVIFTTVPADNTISVIGNVIFVAQPIMTTYTTGIKRITFNPNVLFNDEPLYLFPRHIMTQSDSLTIHQSYTSVDVAESTPTNLTIKLRSRNYLGSAQNYDATDRAYIFIY